jgi:hypothetical protein
LDIRLDRVNIPIENRKAAPASLPTRFETDTCPASRTARFTAAATTSPAPNALAGGSSMPMANSAVNAMR